MIKRSQPVPYQSAVLTVGSMRPTRVAGIQSTTSPARRTVSSVLRVVPPSTVTLVPHVQLELSQAPLPSHGRLRSAALTFVLPRSTLSQHSLMLALAARRLMRTVNSSHLWAAGPLSLQPLPREAALVLSFLLAPRMYASTSAP